MCTIEENVYQGVSSLQLRLRDYKWIECDITMKDIMLLAEFIVDDVLQDNHFNSKIGTWKKEEFELNDFIFDIKSFLFLSE